VKRYVFVIGNFSSTLTRIEVSLHQRHKNLMFSPIVLISLELVLFRKFRLDKTLTSYAA